MDSETSDLRILPVFQSEIYGSDNISLHDNRKMKLWEDIAQNFCRCCKFFSKIRQKEEPKEVFLQHVSHKIENHDIITATNQHLATLNIFTT